MKKITSILFLLGLALAIKYTTSQEVSDISNNNNTTVVTEVKEEPTKESVPHNEAINNLTTEEPPKASQKELILTELKLVEEELLRNQKKIQALEQMRTFSYSGNHSQMYISSNLPGEAAPRQTYEARPYTPGQAHPRISGQPYKQAVEPPKNKGENLMNRILKKNTFDLHGPIKDMSYLVIKPQQKSPDAKEPALSTLVVFLASDNNILLYDINGNFLLNYEPNHIVKGFTVNPATDENYIATLGTDNTIRVHLLTINRVKLEDLEEVDSAQKKKKNDKPKFTLTFNLRLEYIYDLDHNQVIPESICQEICSKKTEKDFKSLSSVQSKQQKYFALASGDESLVVVFRNGTFKGKYDFSDSKLISLQKSYLNPLFTTDKSVGFFNLATMDIANPICEMPGAPIVKAEIDQYSSNNFHVLLANGDVVFYEAKQSEPSCKIISKRSLTSTGTPAHDIQSSKNFVLGQPDAKGINILAFNITDVILSGTPNIETYEVSLYPYKSDQDKVVKGRHITQRSGYSSSWIGAYYEFENGTSSFSVYEMTIITKPPSDWLSDLRLPIIALAVLIVVGYQFYAKKDKKPKRGKGKGLDPEEEELLREMQSRAKYSSTKDSKDITRRSRPEEKQEQKKFNMDDFDNIRREYENAARASRSSRDDQKKVSFEDNENDSGDGDEDQEILYKKNR